MLTLSRVNNKPTRTVLPEELTVACKIGEGGFGAVLKGFWHGKAVAVKQLHERV
jgi:hypothetical protein